MNKTTDPLNTLTENTPWVMDCTKEQLMAICVEFLQRLDDYQQKAGARPNDFTETYDDAEKLYKRLKLTEEPSFEQRNQLRILMKHTLKEASLLFDPVLTKTPKPNPDGIEKKDIPGISEKLINAMCSFYDPAATIAESDETKSTMEIIQEMDNIQDSIFPCEVNELMERSGFKLHYNGSEYVWLLKLKN